MVPACWRPSKNRSVAHQTMRDRRRLRETAPAGHNEYPQFELSGLRAARGSSRDPPAGGGEEACGGVLNGDKDGGGKSSRLG